MKQKFLLLFLFVFTVGFLNAQEAEFERKGKILVESGFNLIGILGGGGTGLGVVIDDGETLFNAGIDGGYFITKDLAIKGQLWILSDGDATLLTVGAGGKYYIKGVAPVEFVGGLLTGEGFSELVARFKLGYGIRLANNINLEPTIGGLIFDGEYATLIGMTFAMFL